MNARVRCSSQHPAQHVRTFLFALECPEHQTTIEYQLSPEHPWQTVVISPGDADSIALLDIAVN